MSAFVPDMNTSIVTWLFPPATAGTTLSSLNAAAIRWMVLFKADRSDTMVGFRIRLGANTGTPTSALQANLYALDANGEPTGSSLATATVTPTGSAINTIAWGTGYALTSGVEYGVVLQNVHATPASNFPTLVGISVPTPYGNYFTVSLDSGATWYYGISTSIMGVHFWAEYGGGTVGIIVATGVSAGDKGAQLYNTSGSRVARTANKYNFPVPVRVFGLVELSGRNKTGSPTHDMKAEICSSSAVLATSSTRLSSANGNGNEIHLFENGYDLAADTDYYIGVTPDGATAGDASNYRRVQGTTTITSPTLADIGSICFGGYTSTAWPGPSWSADTSLMSFVLLISPIAGSGGGAAPNAIRYQGQEGVMAA